MRRQRLALVPFAQPVLSEHVGLARDQRMERIESQPVVVVEIFVAKSQCPDALTQKLGNLVLDQARKPIVRKTPGQSLNESHLQVHPSQKHRPAVAAEVTSGKISRHFAASMNLKFENLLLTLCHSEGLEAIQLVLVRSEKRSCCAFLMRFSAYAEGLGVLRSANIGRQLGDIDAETTPLRHPENYQYDLNLGDIAEVWRRGSVVASWPAGLTASAPVKDANLSEFQGRVSDSGEGRWTIKAAIDEGVPVPVLTTALYASPPAARPITRTDCFPRCALASAGTSKNRRSKDPTMTAPHSDALVSPPRLPTTQPGTTSDKAGVLVGVLVVISLSAGCALQP